MSVFFRINIWNICCYFQNVYSWMIVFKTKIAVDMCMIQLIAQYMSIHSVLFHFNIWWWWWWWWWWRRREKGTSSETKKDRTKLEWTLQYYYNDNNNRGRKETTTDKEVGKRRKGEKSSMKTNHFIVIYFNKYSERNQNMN